MRVMTFDTFCKSIILMGLIAYRESTVSPADKVKAILLFMWRAVNSTDTAIKAVNDRYGVSSRTVQGHAGSLNIHGSGLFSDMFLLSWQADGFPNYITHENKKEDPNEVLSKIVSNHTQTSPIKDNILNVIGEIQQSTMRKTRMIRDTNFGYGEDGDDDDNNNDNRNDDEFGGGMSGVQRFYNEDEDFPQQQQQQVALYGYQIAELFLRKPEIAELIYLEMRHSNKNKINNQNGNINNQLSSNGFGGDVF